MSLTDKDIEVEEAIIKAEGDGTALKASAEPEPVCPICNGTGSGAADVGEFLAYVQERNPQLRGELGQATSIAFSDRIETALLTVTFSSDSFAHLFHVGQRSRKNLEALLEECPEPVEVHIILDEPPIKGSLDAESERKEARGE